jgi:hypothetical protein
MVKIVLDKQKLIEKQREPIKKLRQQAYIEEADPLFFKAQRGDATLEEWQNKIQEIKARYPYTN